MIYYNVKVKVIGHGGLRFGKPQNLQLPDWNEYLEGGRVYKELYQGIPHIPHFLFIYHRRYTVEYHINEDVPNNLHSPNDIAESRLYKTIKPMSGSIICYHNKRYFVNIGEDGRYILSYYQTEILPH